MIWSFVERKTWAFRWIESKFIWLSILWKKIIFSWLVLFPLEGAKYLLHRVIINLYLHDINIYLVVTFPQSYLEYYKILQLEFRISQKVCHYFFEWFALINGVTAGQTLEREWVWIMLCPAWRLAWPQLQLLPCLGLLKLSCCLVNTDGLPGETVDSVEFKFVMEELPRK